MISGAQVGKKSLIGFLSTLSWVVLLASFLATVALLSVDNFKHVGNSASTIVNDLSKNTADINSIIDDFKKHADPKTAAEIDKNRAKINEAITTIGTSKEFQRSVASTLNKISEAILNGSSSVQVDLTKLATLVANAVNKASNSVVISKKELAKLKPKTIQLGKQSKIVNEVRRWIAEVLLAWLLWLLLLGLLFLLKRWKVIRTAGWQLFSVGAMFLIIRYVVPITASNALHHSRMPIYQRDLVPQIERALTGSLVEVSLVAAVAGLVLIIFEQNLNRRTTRRSDQISPSVVA